MAELNRVEVTDAAADLLRDLTATYGPLMFHQSGGCCDGSSPMCYPDGDFITSEADVLLGELSVAGLERPIKFWMSVSQYEYWKHTHLTVDVVQGPRQRLLGRGPRGRAVPDQVPAADRRGARPLLRIEARG